MSHRREFERLVLDHEAMIGRICASYENDRELARELVQERVVRDLAGAPQPSRGKLPEDFRRPHRAVRAISHVAKHSRLPALEPVHEHLLDGRDLPEHQLIRADERNRLLAAVRRLPLTYREVAVLTLEEFTHSEIAASLGISAELVAVRLSRARALLRNLLGETHEG